MTLVAFCCILMVKTLGKIKRRFGFAIAFAIGYELRR